MANYAVVKDGVVENIIVWDGVAEFSVPNSELIEATADTRIGGTYDGTFHFVEPPRPADTRTYAEKRADEYPKIGDQLDMLWHAVDTGDWTAAKVKTTEFYTALKAVKDANPKP
jgi:hypothetical protein